MRRADRLFQIVLMLSRGRVLTARTMGERLDVSERTVYRDIQDLMGSGVPVEGEAGVGYRLRRGYHVPPMMFDERAAGPRVRRGRGEIVGGFRDGGSSRSHPREDRCGAAGAP